MNKLVIAFTAVELAEFIERLKEGREVKLKLPGNWTAYFRLNAPATKAQAARPDEKSWVALVNLNAERSRAFLEALEKLGRGEATEFVLSSLGSLGTLPNLDLRIELKKD